MKKIKDFFHFSNLRYSKSGKGWVDPVDVFSKFSEQVPNILGNAPSSLEPLGSKTEPPNCAQRGQMPVTDRAWAIGKLRKFGAPSAKFPQIANLQRSVCLHVAQSGNTFRGSCLGGHFRIFQIRFLKKGLREPGSKQPKIRRK